MLLSSSELFFIGLVKGFLSVEPLEDVPAEASRHWPPDEDPWTAYKQILEYADACGMDRVPHVENVNQDVADVDFSTILWVRDGTILSETEVTAAQEKLRSATTTARYELQEVDPSGAVTRRFEELLDEDATVMKGYSQKTPHVIYGVHPSGSLRAIHRIKELKQGTLRLLLKTLAPFLDLPPHVHLVIGATTDDSSGWLGKWSKSSFSLWHEQSFLDRISAVKAIECEVVGESKGEQAYILGLHLGQADQQLRVLEDWLRVELQLLEQPLHVASVLDVIPSNPDIYDRDPGLRSEAECLADPEVIAEGGEEEDLWVGKIEKIARRARVQVNLLGGVSDPELGTFLKPQLQELVVQLNASQEAARALGIDSVGSIVERSLSTVEALLNEGNRPADSPVSRWVRSQKERRCGLLDCVYERVVAGAVPLVFGELRLRDLKFDLIPAGVGPVALQAWGNLTSNARDAVREGLAMLQRGSSPYLVMNCTAPALEVIVRKLAEQNLHKVDDVRIGSILHELREYGKNGNNSQLEFAASVGLTLRFLRNEVTHNAEREYSRDEAAFFLNGLRLMLQAVS